MSRKGFWVGLLVGLIVMGLLASVAGFVLLRSRWAVGSALAFRGQPFSFGPRERLRGFGSRGWGFGSGFPGRHLGLGALVCGVGLLFILGAVVLVAVLCQHRCWHRSAGEAWRCDAQKPSEVETKQPGDEPPAEAGHTAAANPT